MEIAVHLGAHCTDGDRLLRSLLRNRGPLGELGVAVPGPGHYRNVMRDVMIHLRGAQASGQTCDMVLDTILDTDQPARLILSNPSFLSMPTASLGGGLLYPKAYKAAWIRDLFPGHGVALFLSLRNPATFVPALFALTGQPPRDFPGAFPDLDPLALRWSRTVADIRDACPDCPLTLWLHEEAPLLWGEIMRALCGVTEAAGLHGGFDLLREIISDEGLKKLRHYTKVNPPADDRTRRRIVGAFLDKFALPDAMEVELDLPGWTADLVARMSATYEADLADIAAIPGVRLLRA